MLDHNLHFLASEYEPKAQEQALFHVYPVPLEKSVSYGRGTSLGPQAILAASQQLEASENGIYPGKLGIYTANAINCTQNVEDVLENISCQVCSSVNQDKIPILLGGEHTVTLGALRGFAKAKRKVGIVQFDAHADLRLAYEGNTYSHASVMYQALLELGFELVQFGIRDFCAEEVDHQRRFNVVAHTAQNLADYGLPDPILPLTFPKDIYVTFDVDGFDASLMPATGTPSPGGLFWHEARKILQLIAKSHKICGFDVVELAPIHNLHACDFTAAKLVHMLMALAVHS